MDQSSKSGTGDGAQGSTDPVMWRAMLLKGRTIDESEGTSHEIPVC